MEIKSKNNSIKLGRKGLVRSFGVVYLLLIGCGSNNAGVVPPVSNIPAATSYGSSSTLDGTWHVLEVTCNGQVEDQSLYSTTAGSNTTIVLSPAGGASGSSSSGQITFSQTTPPCNESGQISATYSPSQIGTVQVSLRLVGTLAPAGCSMYTDPNYMGMITVWKSAPISYSLSNSAAGLGGVGGMTGANPYGNLGGVGVGTTGTETLTSISPVACRAGGSGTQMILLSH